MNKADANNNKREVPQEKNEKENNEYTQPE